MYFGLNFSLRYLPIYIQVMEITLKYVSEHTMNIVVIILITKCRPVADWAKSAGIKQLLYISSAGIYKTGDEFPHLEGVCSSG